jgi:hypothetical protein
MKEILLTSPTGEMFLLHRDGSIYIHQYDYAKIDFATAAGRVRRWVDMEGWDQVFKAGWYPLTVEDFTTLPGNT